MDADNSIADEFVIEAKEHLDNMEKTLLDLEKGKGEPSKELINTIYRNIHTIKGAAGFLGFIKVGDLSHAMESLLSLIREEVIQIEAKYIDILLAGIDILNTMMDDIKESNSTDIKDIIVQLKSFLTDADKKKISNTASKESLQKENGCLNQEDSIIISPEHDKDIFFTIGEHIFEQLETNKLQLYILRYDLLEFKSERGESPIALLQKLSGKGKIVDSRIKTTSSDLSKGLPDSSLIYYVLYSSELSLQKVSQAVELPKNQVKQIKKSTLKQNKKPIEEKAEQPVKNKEPIEPKIEIKTPEEKIIEPEEVDETKEIEIPEKTELVKDEEKAISKSTSSPKETIRINVDILDKLMMLAGEMVLVRNQQLLAMDRSEPVPYPTVQRLNIVTSELQENIMRTRMQPIGNIFSKFSRIVRELGKKLEKEIELSLIGNEVELDKKILESLNDPLTHLIRNCCDHAIESSEIREKAGKPITGNVCLRAFHENGQINIEIKDDGKGIDPKVLKDTAFKKGLKTEAELEKMGEKELLALIFLAGLSTVEKVSDVSGRGVGMDVVKTNIEKLGGVIDIKSQLGVGTSIYLRMPLTLAIIPCLIVMSGEIRYAIPQINIEELVCLYDVDVYKKIECTENKEVFRMRGHLLPMVRINEVLARQTSFTDKTSAEITEYYRQKNLTGKNGDKSHRKEEQSLNFVALKIGESRFGLIVNKIIGTEEIVVKPMHPALKSLPIYSGATVLGDGKVALILDILGLGRHANVSLDDYRKDIDSISNKKEIKELLLFKCGEKEQFATILPLIKRIEHIKFSDIEKIGEKEFITIEGNTTFVLRLDKFLNVSETTEKDTMYLLLPKHIENKFGILLSELTDIGSFNLEINTTSYTEDGLIGTALVKEKMTLFIDIFALIEKAQPEWFAEKIKKNIEKEKSDHILLVEDDTFFRQLIKGYLEGEGYKVSTAENGRFALGMICKSKFDLIVSDLEMPVMDGWDFMQAIRKGDEAPDILSIALTGLDTEQGREKARKSGFDRYKLKLEKDELIGAITELLHAE